MYVFVIFDGVYRVLQILSVLYLLDQHMMPCGRRRAVVVEVRADKSDERDFAYSELPKILSFFLLDQLPHGRRYPGMLSKAVRHLDIALCTTTRPHTIAMAYVARFVAIRHARGIYLAP